MKTEVSFPVAGSLLLGSRRGDLAGATALRAVVASLGGLDAARMSAGFAVGFRLRAAARDLGIGGRENGTGDEH